MNAPERELLRTDMLAIGRQAREAARALRGTSGERRSEALARAASAVRARATDIAAANVRDVRAAKGSGATLAFIDRLFLDPARIEAMAKTIEEIAALPDPLARELAHWTRPNGLDIARVPTPIGVIAMIYESRPNVTADAGALALKSANASILRGGSETAHSADVIHAAMIEGIRATGIPETAIQLVRSSDRAAVSMLLEGLDGSIDLIIPRGGKNLTSLVSREARVPVLAHLEGVCHVYVHEAAELAMARAIVVNAKMRRTGICGAAETLLIDRSVLLSHGVPILTDLAGAGCEIRGDEEVRAAFARALPAGEEDWREEYLDSVISVRAVRDIEEAIRHIETYGSHHTEAVVTNDKAAAEHFLAEVDSAIVLWNASTQFADGGEFGMGAEIGIGTGKLHARGPVGLEQLTSFKYIVRGRGQTRP